MFRILKPFLIFTILYLLLSTSLANITLSEEVSIAIVGDIMFGPDIGKIMDREGSMVPFAGVSQVLKESDIIYGILEGGISTGGEPVQDKENTFRSRPSAARGLSNAGFNLVNLANPHIMDYGEKGLLETMEYLSWYGVKYVGAGLNPKEARKPVIIEAKGVKVAFLAYYRGSEFDQVFGKEKNPGPAFPLYGELESDVELARSQADIVIASIHWGVRTDESGINERQKLYSQNLIDYGADAVFGQWLHELQGIQLYNNKPIVHSLGDFIYGTYAKKIHIGYIIRLVIADKKLQRVEIIPVTTSNAVTGSFFPTLLNGQPALDAIMTLEKLSQDLGTQINTDKEIGIINFQ
jgi:poly-gamma-glutamate capsule biosynthesis protein CapA/YwtB (metallophosphatase superfamily)